MTCYFLVLASLAAADWLSSSADPQHTRVQIAETELSPATVTHLQLLWKLPFRGRLTAPVVLGPIYTHRGIKELVFLADAGNNLYSVDADLGRLFWTRRFDTTPVTACNTGLTAAPVLAPFDGPIPPGGDASTPRRSLFVLTSDGQLHTVRPADAKDLLLPISLVPSGSVASDLTLTGNVISTYVSQVCNAGATGQYAITVNRAGATAVVTTELPRPAAAVFGTDQVSVRAGSLTATRNGRTLWAVRGLDSALPPIMANGVVFTVSGSSLRAFAMRDGKQLFISGPNGLEPARDSLAVANGHVYFVAGETLYCYGFPIEI